MSDPTPTKSLTAQLLDAVEVRAVLTLLIACAAIAAVFVGKMDPRDLSTAFLLTLGFYFGSKSLNTSTP